MVQPVGIVHLQKLLLRGKFHFFQIGNQFMSIHHTTDFSKAARQSVAASTLVELLRLRAETLKDKVVYTQQTHYQNVVVTQRKIGSLRFL